MFIGEAPGAQEDKYGVPFVGNAGILFNKSLDNIGFSREDIFVTNVIKCRPTNNRTPNLTQVNNCKIYLEYELDFIKPKIIVLLGNTAMRVYFGNNNLKITQFRGKVVNINNTIILPIYHPSYVIRNLDDDKITNNWYNDFIQIVNIYKKVVNPLHMTKLVK
jgi:DNA polymerase